MIRLFYFILSHSFFIALCATALSFQTGQLTGISTNPYLLSFIFFGTLSGYNAYWLISKFSFSSSNSFRLLFSSSRISLFVFIMALVGMLFCYLQLNLFSSSLFIAGGLFIFYLLPILPFKNLYWIKRWGFLKTVLLAFTWTIVTTLIPLQVPIWEMEPLVTLVFIHRLLFMMLLCIIFDKRDAAIDKISGLQSMATFLNPLKLHFLIGFIFISYLIVNYFMKACGIGMAHLISLSLIGLIALIMYIFSLQKRGYLFYYFGVDGLMFFSAIMTWLSVYFKF
jgi:hypothetical protein